MFYAKTITFVSPHGKYWRRPVLFMCPCRAAAAAAGLENAGAPPPTKSPRRRLLPTIPCWPGWRIQRREGGRQRKRVLRSPNNPSASDVQGYAYVISINYNNYNNKTFLFLIMSRLNESDTCCRRLKTGEKMRNFEFGAERSILYMLYIPNSS